VSEELLTNFGAVEEYCIKMREFTCRLPSCRKCPDDVQIPKAITDAGFRFFAISGVWIFQ